MRLDLEPTLVDGGSDQVHDDLVADEGTAPSVQRHRAPKSVPNAIPFARVRRQVAHGDLQAAALGEPAQLPIPKSHPMAVRPAGIGGDQQPPGARIGHRTHHVPSPADGRHRERGGLIPRSKLLLVNAEWDGLADLGAGEIMHVDSLGRPLGWYSRPLLASWPTTSFFSSRQRSPAGRRAGGRRPGRKGTRTGRRYQGAGRLQLRGGALPRPAHRGLPLDTRVHLSDGLLHRGETHVSRAATTASPPRPSALAFAPARARRWRSSSTGVTAPNILVSAASDTSTSQAYLRAPKSPCFD